MQSLKIKEREMSHHCIEQLGTHSSYIIHTTAGPYTYTCVGCLSIEMV